MRAVDQWSALERQLPAGWAEARLSFAAEDPSARAGAAAVLAPLGPGRVGDQLRFHLRRSGVSGPESVRNLLARLDGKRIWGELSLIDVRVPDVGTEAGSAGVDGSPSLVDAWDDALNRVPPDWTDLLCEVELDSSDYVPRAALLGAPLNPSRNPESMALRFRVSRRGYGAFATMARRCFERMDAERITGRVTVVRVLSETDHVGTQGPVWRVAGRSV